MGATDNSTATPPSDAHVLQGVMPATFTRCTFTCLSHLDAYDGVAAGSDDVHGMDQVADGEWLVRGLWKVAMEDEPQEWVISKGWILRRSPPSPSSTTACITQTCDIGCGDKPQAVKSSEFAPAMHQHADGRWRLDDPICTWGLYLAESAPGHPKRDREEDPSAVAADASANPHAGAPIQEIIGSGEGCFKDGKHVRMKLRQEEEDAAGAAADPQSEKLPNASEDDDELDLWS